MKEYKSKMNKFQLKKENSDFQKVKITSSKDAKEVIRQFYSDDIGIYESFFLLLMNRANNTIGWAKISQGGVVGTVVDNKIIGKYVVDSLAQGVIIAHNHPSGNIHPSESDKILTKKLIDMLKIFEVQVLDHIILSGEDEKYFSFADEGIL